MINLNIDIFNEYVKFKNTLRDKERSRDQQGFDSLFISNSPIKQKKKDINNTEVGEFNHFMLTPGGVYNYQDSINLNSNLNSNQFIVNGNGNYENNNPESLNFLISKGMASNIIAVKKDNEAEELKKDKGNNSSSEEEPVECKEKIYPKNSLEYSKNDRKISDKKLPFINKLSTDVNVTVIFEFKPNLKEDYLDNMPKQNIKERKHYLFDKKFKIKSKKDKNFTKSDIVYYKSSKIQLTNSVVYFLNHFFKKEEFFKFNKKITTKPISVIETKNII